MTAARRPLTPDDERHGTFGAYTNHGCRCAKCRAANTAYNIRRRAERADLLALGLVDVEHGKWTTYSNYGCRCQPCTTAYTLTSYARGWGGKQPKWYRESQGRA